MVKVEFEVVKLKEPWFIDAALWPHFEVVLVGKKMEGDVAIPDELIIAKMRPLDGS